MRSTILATLLLLTATVLVFGDLRSDNASWLKNGPTPVIRRTGKLPNSFDFVIVGGGTAGCVLANRLSAHYKVKVLLIESGTVQDNTDLVSIPLNWDRTPLSPFDHSYLNEGQETQLNWDNGKRHVAAGKALGGTTAINTMMYVRGNKLDFASWNVPGWSYNDVLPYYKKAENSSRYYDPSIPNRTYYHGNSGPLNIGPSGWQPPEDDLLIQAAAAWGLPFTPDWNGETQIGSGFHEHTIDPSGKRITSFSAYLKPVLSRNNLWVMDSSEVQRIRFKTSGGKPRASSVVFVDNIVGKVYEVKAKKEVILSAGALRSPQILQISGIGPAAELQRIGVPVIKNLPGVGQNLQDHPITTIPFGTTLVTSDPTGGEINQAAFDLYHATGTGIVGSITARTNFFFRSSKAVDARPDAQIIVTPPTTSGAFALCYLNRPRSRGQLRVFSKDPTDPPRITANYYQNPDDLDAMVDIMNKTAQILSKAPIGAFPYVDMSSVDSLKNYIVGSAASFTIANTGSGYHFVGTCKMGNTATDPNAVVDNRLKVSGVLGLRVADASIMPEIITGNTQAATYMIAEKASDLILQDNNC